MSNIPKLLYHRLVWSEYLHILSYLELHEVYHSIGRSSKNGYIVYLREKNVRSSSLSTLCRFLSQGLKQEKVVLVSYPRSGNSFLRLLLEERTGIITGSDSRTNRTLSAALLRCGFKGEGIVDSSVWIIKSHYPERMGYIKFTTKRVILLVRNPFDALESYFHMGLTNTHNKSLSDETLLQLSSLWNRYVESEINVWIAFHEWWLRSENRISVMILRYEDLLLNQYDSMENLMTFLNEGNIPQGYQRFTNNIENDLSINSAGYKPKQGGIGKSFKVFTDEQVSTVVSKCSHLLKQFGYRVMTNDDSSARKYSGIEVHSLNINDKAPSSIFLSSSRQGHVIINDHYGIRGDDDEFGRKMTTLRKSMTDDDKLPFPVKI